MELRLIGVDQRAAVGFDNADHKLFDLAFDALQLARRFVRLFLGVALALVPARLEHGLGCEQQLLRRPDGVEQRVERRFEMFLAD
ncbi:hypothetical protein [Hyphomicrobium album]|uniref:hypothetical protein n=1 Tax=Hyphomicrobium album TaxID=2665159 RepID=UPI001E403186|nr:hypothetical protein [Hyphomicrobium album]